MEFTDLELSIMSSAVIRLMEETGKAKSYVVDGNLYDQLDDYIKELVRLNTKICNYMEG